MAKSNQIKEVASLLFKTIDGLKISETGIIHTSGGRIKDNDFLRMELLPLLLKQGMAELMSDEMFMYELKKAMRKRYQEVLVEKDIHSNDERRAEIQNLLGTDIPSLAHLVPCVDLSNANKKMLLNTVTNRPSNIDVETYRLVHNLKPEFIPVILDFDPYDITPLKTIAWEGLNVTRVNLYLKPDWQKGNLDKTTNVKLSCPAIIQKFLTHLVPSVECRDFLLDWMHFSLVSRCETYLVLNGAKGIGKNILAEHLMKPLIGKDYFTIAPESALESNFNSYLSGKRLVLLDEVKADLPPKVAKLKRYINEYQNVEFKGVDATKDSKTFNSFILSNNDETDVRLSWDDRRFSVIDLTRTKLEDAWDRSDIQDLVRIDDEVFSQFAHWIFYRTPKVMVDEFSVWKGSHFYRLCYSSLPEWSKALIDLILSRQYLSYTMSDLKRVYRARNSGGSIPRIQKIADFLENYRHDGKYCLATIEGSGESLEIVPTKHYRPMKFSKPEDIVSDDYAVL